MIFFKKYIENSKLFFNYGYVNILINKTKKESDYIKNPILYEEGEFFSEEPEHLFVISLLITGIFEFLGVFFMQGHLLITTEYFDWIYLTVTLIFLFFIVFLSFSKSDA
jgi:hypothetical protein